MLSSHQTSYVSTEGERIYYEIRGKGPAIILIPGANGDADVYMALADLLAADYKVITYDRRANSRSIVKGACNFEIGQQSRDVLAVLRATGESSAVIFGSSSGAQIALDIAQNHPKAARAVIAHEPPAARLHPNSKKWQRFFASVYRTGLRYGSSIAAIRFLFGIQVSAVTLVKAHKVSIEYAKEHRTGSDMPRLDQMAAADILMQHELLPITNYLPDLKMIKQNKVPVYMAVSEYGRRKKTWLADVATRAASELNCKIVTMPGYHGSYTDMPKEWNVSMRKLLEQIE